MSGDMIDLFSDELDPGSETKGSETKEDGSKCDCDDKVGDGLLGDSYNLDDLDDFDDFDNDAIDVIVSVLQDFKDDKTRKTEGNKIATKGEEIANQILHSLKIDKLNKKIDKLKSEKEVVKKDRKKKKQKLSLPEYKSEAATAKKNLSTLNKMINQIQREIANLVDPLPKTLGQIIQRCGNIIDVDSIYINKLVKAIGNIRRNVRSKKSDTYSPWICVPKKGKSKSKYEVKGKTVELGTWGTYKEAVEILNFIFSRRIGDNGEYKTNWWTDLADLDKNDEYIKLMGSRIRRSNQNNSYPKFWKDNKDFL